MTSRATFCSNAEARLRGSIDGTSQSRLGVDGVDRARYAAFGRSGTLRRLRGATQVTSKSLTTVMLTGAGGSAAANVCESLRLASTSYRIVGLDASPVKLHLSTADERVVGPRSSEPDYVEELIHVLEKFRPHVLHPQPDPDVLAIGAARDRLPVATCLPSQEALEIAADKLALADRMLAGGVGVPDHVAFDDMDSLEIGTKNLLSRHERVWIRIRTGAGAQGSLPVRTADQALAWVRWWVEERGLTPADFMASEHLPGREFAYQSIWQMGELVAGQARERLEYLYGHLTPHGQTSTPSVARTVNVPAVDEVAIHAIRALDSRPHGAYCVDMKETAGGRPVVTEINAGRFFTTSNFFAAAGLNMPDMLVRSALGERLPLMGTSLLEPELYWIRMVDMGHVLVRGCDVHAWSGTDR